jgi:hypothetical protein
VLLLLQESITQKSNAANPGHIRFCGKYVTAIFYSFALKLYRSNVNEKLVGG